MPWETKKFLLPTLLWHSPYLGGLELNHNSPRYTTENNKGKTHILKVSIKRTQINYKEKKLMVGIFFFF